MSSKSNKEGFYTLKDLAEYCHEAVLSERDVLCLLSDKLVVWIRDDLGEKEISQKVRDIISQETAYSEKVYRFLKLCGVFSEKILIELFKKLRLRELETEKEYMIVKVKLDIQKRINEKMAKERKEKLISWIKWGGLIGLILGTIIGIIEGIEKLSKNF